MFKDLPAPVPVQPYSGTFKHLQARSSCTSLLEQRIRCPSSGGTIAWPTNLADVGRWYRGAGNRPRNNRERRTFSPSPSGQL